MTHGSLFAGIGSFDLALQRCGVETAWAAEKDPKCNSVRRRHFPNEETLTDVAAVSGPRFRVDVLTAGWPCQGNSVAGKRAGMADERSGLWGEVKRVLAEQRPTWFLGENVVGILSVNRGRDWLTVIRDLAELRFRYAWRVLDAQFAGVPQRRRRVFLVANSGDGPHPGEILFESEIGPWDTPPSREAGAGVAGSLSSSAGSGGLGGVGCSKSSITSRVVAAPTANGVGTCGADDNQGQAGHLVATGITARYGKGADSDATDTLICGPLQTGSTPEGHGMEGVNDQAVASGHVVPVAYQCHGSDVGRMGTLRSGHGDVQSGVPFVPVAFQPKASITQSMNPSEVCPTLGITKQPGIAYDMAVRRILPIEAERLMGFPDNWTQFGEHGEEVADGPRYRMLGNSIAVPVVEWIAGRMLAVNSYMEILKGE